MPFEEKRNIVELITNDITIGKSDINISLSYLPTPNLFPKAGKSDRGALFQTQATTVPLPDKRPFPNELQTVGNHIKHTRLSQNMLIKDVIAHIKD